MNEAEIAAMRADLEKQTGGKVYTTNEATEAFTFHGFMAPFVSVTEKATGKKGSLQFTHMPRFYFSFMAD